MAVSLLDASTVYALERPEILRHSSDHTPEGFRSAGKIVDDAESVSRVGLIRDADDPPEDLKKLEKDLHNRIVLDARAALKLERSVVSAHPFFPLATGGLVAMFAVMIGDRLARRRKSRTEVGFDPLFEANAFVVPANRLDEVIFAKVETNPVEFAIDDPLRHFHPDAPPVKASAAERSRPDYIRVDDSVEVWTPSKVDATRDPVSPARRRRTDAPGADYRFHRLNGDGSVKTAERKKFITDLDATRFAETIGRGDAVEVWLGDRRLTTIPANYFT